MQLSFRWTTVLAAALTVFSLQAKALDLKGAFERGIQQIERGIEKAIEQIEKDPEPSEPPAPSPRTTETAPSPGVAPQTSETVDRRHLVAETQERLNRLGYDAGPVDGLMGSRTRRAFEAFQRANGLAPTGRPDDSLLATLRAAAPPAGTPGSNPQTAGIATTPRATNPAALSTGTGPTGTGSFGVPAFETTPEPDYLSMFRLYMASNADLLENDAFAFEHYTVFGITAGADQQPATRACLDLGRKMRNEISRLSVLAEAHALLAQNLKQVGSWPRTAVFRLMTTRWLEEYDVANQRFPLGREAGGSIPFSHAIGIAKTTIQQDHGAHYQGPVPWLCNAGFNVRGLSGIKPDNLAIQVLNGGLVTHLPMPLGAAETYLNKHGRQAKLEYLVEVGPVVHGAPAPAKIIAARAVDPDGNVLRVYDSGLFRDESSGGFPLVSGGSGSEERVPLAHHVLWLLTLREHPELLDGEPLERFAKQQVFTEQRIWKEIDEFMAATGGDPSQPMLLYEWQNLVDTDPDTARAILKNLYVAEQADWKFAEDAGVLDPRLRYRQKQAFIFARQGIVGRETEFAARELVPVLKRHILAASALAPGSVYFEVALPEYEYDFGRAAIVFAEYGETSPLRAATGIAFDSESALDPRRSARFVLPDALETRAFYAFAESMAPRLVRAQGAGASNSAHEHWREHFSRLTPYTTYLLALDRSLLFGQIPLPPAEAERWERERRSQNLLARVLVNVERVDLGTRKFTELDDRSAPVLVANLAGVEIVTRAGDVLISLPPDAFPSAAGILATAEAAAEAEARARAEQAEAEQLAQESAAERLAALLAGRTGLVIIRRAETTGIETVYAGANATEYSQIVEANSLDLPARSKGATTRGMSEALRDERGAAIVVHTSVFARDIFGLVADLNLQVSSFPPEEAEGLSPDHAAALAALAPGDSKYLLLRRRDDQEPLTRVVVQDAGGGTAFYSSAMREAAPWSRHLEELGDSIAFELPEKAERVDLRGIPGVLRDQSGTAVVLPREGLQSIFPKIADLDLVARRFPPEEFHVGIPKDHTEGAESFAILGVSGGLDEAAALAAVNEAFAPDEIAEAGPGTVRAARGACDMADLATAGTQDEVGAYCLVLHSTNGAISHVALRQVVPGNAEEAALKALRERYGRSPFMTEIRHLDRGGKRTVHGWGAPLSADRASLGRVDAKTPPTVLEAVVWVANDVTTILLHLDDVSTLGEVKAAQTPEIKF